jgi:phage terminase large subunit GpA-like protein
MSTIVANPFGGVAKEFVQCRGRPGTEWLNRRRGLPFRVAAKRVEAAELRKLCVAVAEGGYRLGQCPPGTLALTLAVDVPQREAYCTVRGWGAHGRQSALVWAECVPIDAEAGKFEAITRVMAMRFGMRDDPAKTLGVGATGIDSGHFTEQVYGLVAELRARGVVNVWAIKGDGGRAVVHPIHETQIDLSKKSRFSVPIGLLILKVNYWKLALAGRIHGEELLVADMPDSGLPEGRGFMLPADAGEEYLAQLTSEERVLEHVSGQPVYVFKPRRGFNARNHYWDTEVYGLAVAKRAGVDALTAQIVAPVTPAPRRERPGGLKGAGRGMLDWRRGG